MQFVIYTEHTNLLLIDIFINIVIGIIMGYNKKQRPYRNERNKPYHSSFTISAICLLLFLGCAYAAMNQGVENSELIRKRIEDSYEMTDEDFARLENPGCVEVGEEFITPIENMPRFPGCEDLDISIEERKKCAEKKLLKFVYENLRYPTRTCGGGMIVINFTIDKEGNVIHPKILRGIGGGFNEEGLRVVRSMPQWIPAKQDGKPIDSDFNLPIRFKIYQ